MSFVKLADRVKETSTTTGTGIFELAGAPTGYQTFITGIGNGQQTFYAIIHTTGSEWEIGLGTILSGPSRIQRDIVYNSTNGNSTVNFSEGVKEVICTYPASKAAYMDPSGNRLHVSGGLSVTGSLDITGLINATIASASWALTASYSHNGGGASDWNSLTGKPVGLVSSSTQIPSVSFASTVMWTGVNNKPTVVSSSAQVAFSGITGVPSGLVSSSTQIPSVSFASTTTWTGVNNKPAGLISSSTQIILVDSASSANSVQWNNVSAKPIGIVSSSGQVSFTGLTGIPAGLLSSSAQIGLVNSASYALQALSASWAPSTEGAPTSWGSITDKPVGIVSSSGQVSYTGLANRPIGIVSASGQVSFTGLSNIPGGLVSSSNQIPSVSFASTVMWTGVNNKPVGIISSSTQIGLVTSASYSITSSFATNAAVVTASYFSGSVSFPNGLVVTGSITGSAFSGTSSYALLALSASWAPGGGSVTWNDISGKPTGLVSSSNQIPSVSFASTTTWNGVNNKPIGLVSSSTQIGLISSASYAVTSSYALSSLAVTASYFSGSITFPNGLIVTGSITGSAFSGTSSYAISASWAPGGGSVNWNDVAGKPAGIISSSTQTVMASSSYSETASFSGYQRSTISHVIASSGSIITTGYKGCIQLPYACYIESASIFSNVSGSVAVDIRRVTSFALWSPNTNNGTSITASASPLSQSNVVKTQNTTLTSWTRTLDRGDILSFVIAAASGSNEFNNVVISLDVRKI